MDSGRPYIDLKVTKDYIIREFDDSTHPDELKWHMDRESRKIEVIKGNDDWLFQFDEALPIPLTQVASIPQNTFHRLIKGTGKLVLKIYKL